MFQQLTDLASYQCGEYEAKFAAKMGAKAESQWLLVSTLMRCWWWEWW